MESLVWVMILSKYSQPRRGGRCITGGGAKRNRRLGTPPKQSPARARYWIDFDYLIIDQSFDNVVPAGLLIACDNSPAVALRYTAGYAHHAPCGATENIL
ncbi:MAG: hypothetical protein LBL62_12315 [Planctomycetaceae bacterium]|jgi:hypothetical protein|nr:hypothetical protein [Planctomycetaceae bacterium]